MISFLILLTILIFPIILSKRNHQLEVFKTYSPSRIGDDVRFCSVTKVVQEIKKSIADSDPTLVPVVELRKLFFETLLRPVHDLELEYNNILGNFVILRNKFKDYIDVFLEFDNLCTVYLNSIPSVAQVQSPHLECIKIMPSLLKHIDSMVDIVDSILIEPKLEERIFDIQSALSREGKRLQEIEQDRRNEYQGMWTFKSIDLRGFKESRDQIFNMESFLVSFGSSFQQFKLQLKAAQNALSASYTAVNIEVQLERIHEGETRKDIVQNLLDYLWRQNEVSYLSLKTVAEPDVQTILVKLPQPGGKTLL